MPKVPAGNPYQWPFNPSKPPPGAKVHYTHPSGFDRIPLPDKIFEDYVIPLEWTEWEKKHGYPPGYHYPAPPYVRPQPMLQPHPSETSHARYKDPSKPDVQAFIEIYDIVEAVDELHAYDDGTEKGRDKQSIRALHVIDMKASGSRVPEVRNIANLIKDVIIGRAHGAYDPNTHVISLLPPDIQYQIGYAIGYEEPARVNAYPYQYGAL